MSDKREIQKSVPLKKVITAAAMDMREDFSLVERSYTHWAARGMEKLYQEVFVSSVRKAIIPVNRKFNTAILDCDVTEDNILFVGRINHKGEKVPFHINSKLADLENVETFPDENTCDAKCNSCFTKQLCNDLQTTEVLRTIIINDVEYTETKNLVLQPDGFYMSVTETPYYNNVDEEVQYLTKKEKIAALELESCGCIKNTVENCETIRQCNYGCYCTHCSSVCCDIEEVGYKFFPDSGVIKFDKKFHSDNFYMEWAGTLPKKNGQYLVPAIASETLTWWVKYMAIHGKKNEPKWRIDMFEQGYITARDSMNMVRGRMDWHSIVNALSTHFYDC